MYCVLKVHAFKVLEINFFFLLSSYYQINVLDFFCWFW